jgi:hypothetical protein
MKSIMTHEELESYGTSHVKANRTITQKSDPRSND